MNSVGFVFLPIAAGIDLLGLLFFVVVAVLSALNKGFGKQQEEKNAPPRPIRRIPPRQPTPSAPSTENEEDIPDLAEQMRRFLEDIQKPQQVFSPPTPPIQTPLPHPIHFPQVPIQTIVREVKPATASQSKETTFVYEAEKKSMDTGIREEIAQSMRSLGQDIKFTKGELTATPTSERILVVPSGIGFNFSMLRSPANLKQAIILSEILGKPKALTAPAFLH